ncbi:zinc carboxypeptidase [Xylariaceae sp. FL0594]|nr:zinc carboxypeptidase [Xylariaceae sp. FL0594]
MVLQVPVLSSSLSLVLHHNFSHTYFVNMKLTSLLLLAGLSSACLLPEERAGGSIRRSGRLGRRQSSNNGKAIGKGDRFNGGKIFPRGIGSGNATDMSTILNVAEVGTGIQGLVAEYGIETFTTPYKTYEGRTITGFKVGGASGASGNSKYHVYLNGGIHARERGSHDNVLYFISDLLYAQKHGTGLTYGKKSYTNADVLKALSAGIVVTPLINPDGVNYDQTTNSCWRKNRNPKSSSSSPGVDLNRNFDFAWDLKKWASSVRSSVASSSPSSEVFHGTAPFSEPETQSMKYVLDNYPKVRWFIDVHSYAGDVLYSWGSDTDQSTQPYKNFLNSTYDSVRGITGDSTTSKYGEYITADDLAAAKSAGTRMGSAMKAATGNSYTVMQSANLYATSGASDDYAFSRHIADPSKNKVYSYTVEFGFGNNAASCPFYPTAAQYTSSLQETNAGFSKYIATVTARGKKPKSNQANLLFPPFPLLTVSVINTNIAISF